MDPDEPTVKLVFVGKIVVHEEHAHSLSRARHNKFYKSKTVMFLRLTKLSSKSAKNTFILFVQESVYSKKEIPPYPSS